MKEAQTDICKIGQWPVEYDDKTVQEKILASLQLLNDCVVVRGGDEASKNTSLGNAQSAFLKLICPEDVKNRGHFFRIAQCTFKVVLDRVFEPKVTSKPIVVDTVKSISKKDCECLTYIGGWCICKLKKQEKRRNKTKNNGLCDSPRFSILESLHCNKEHAVNTELTARRDHAENGLVYLPKNTSEFFNSVFFKFESCSSQQGCNLDDYLQSCASLEPFFKTCMHKDCQDLFTPEDVHEVYLSIILKVFRVLAHNRASYLQRKTIKSVAGEDALRPSLLKAANSLMH